MEEIINKIPPRKKEKKKNSKVVRIEERRRSRNTAANKCNSIIYLASETPTLKKKKYIYKNDDIV